MKRQGSSVPPQQVLPPIHVPPEASCGSQDIAGRGVLDVQALDQLDARVEERGHLLGGQVVVKLEHVAPCVRVEARRSEYSPCVSPQRRLGCGPAMRQ